MAGVDGIALTSHHWLSGYIRRWAKSGNCKNSTRRSSIDEVSNVTSLVTCGLEIASSLWLASG
jgi:hypothetical protein